MKELLVDLPEVPNIMVSWTVTVFMNGMVSGLKVIRMCFFIASNLYEVKASAVPNLSVSI